MKCSPSIRERNDDYILLAIMEEDLMAKEFKMHPACLKEYTNIFSKTEYHLASSTSVAEPDNENKSQQKADFYQKDIHCYLHSYSYFMN